MGEVIDLDKYDRVCEVLKESELLSLAKEIYSEFIYDENRLYFIFSDMISGTDLGFLSRKIDGLSEEDFSYLVEILEVFDIGYATLEDNYLIFVRDMRPHDVRIDARRRD